VYSSKTNKEPGIISLALLNKWSEFPDEREMVFRNKGRILT